MQPFLTLVTTARNDDYGGRLIERINTSVKVIAYLAEKYELECEYVVVEYNPQDGKELLSAALSLPQNPYMTYRFITVPRSFHTRFDTKIPVLEYVAKNIGIRRARGSYVLATNPDIIFSDEIFAFIAHHKANEHVFYRTNRHDLMRYSFPEQLSAEEILEAAPRNVGKILFNKKTAYTGMKEWWSMFIHTRTVNALKKIPLIDQTKNLEDRSIHENAAGDFLLMHRALWEKARGYDQTPMSSYYDSYILYVLQCYGFKQEILPYPIYHINHLVGKGGRSEMPREKFREDIANMERTKQPYKINPENWGFPEETFSEVIF